LNTKLESIKLFRSSMHNPCLFSYSPQRNPMNMEGEGIVRFWPSGTHPPHSAILLIQESFVVDLHDKAVEEYDLLASQSSLSFVPTEWQERLLQLLRLAIRLLALDYSSIPFTVRY